MSLLPDYTQTIITKDTTNSTSQSRAFQFMLNDPSLDEYDDWRIQQRFALAVFYHATHGNYWFNSRAWLSYDIHECAWASMPSQLTTNLIHDKTNYYQPNPFTVVSTQSLSNYSSNPCEEQSRNDIRIGRYHHLWQQQNNISGTLPPEVFDMLPALRTINLDPQMNNDDCYYDYPNGFGCASKLTGSLPSEVGRLTGLEVLSLEYHGISGPLPSTLGQLGLLQTLRLHANNITGPLPLAFYELANLRFLDLARNPFLSGTIAPEVGELGNLEDVLLYQTALTGTIPCRITTLSNLIRLDVGGKHFRGSICTEFGNLSNLEHLLIQSNDMRGEPPPNDIGLLTRLTGTIPPQLGQLTKLVNLHLSYNLLSGTVPTTIGQLTALKSLVLNNNLRLSGPIPTQLGNLSSLEYFNLYLNALTGTIPNSIGSLAADGSLQVMFIGGNAALSGTTPPDLCSIEFEKDCLSPCGCSDSVCSCSSTMPPTAVESSSGSEGNIFSRT